MRLIGLTGGIATGKSTVARMLTDRGATLVDADELARRVVERDQPAYAAVVERFGSEVVNPDGTLDRGRLGAVVFADPKARRDLERITHARIGELMQRRIADAFARDAPVTIVDIPLLYEATRDDMFEGVLLIYAPRAEQLRRMMSRDGFSEAEAIARLDAQLPIESKRNLATWVIDNGGDLRDTERQVAAWWGEEIGG